MTKNSITAKKNSLAQSRRKKANREAASRYYERNSALINAKKKMQRATELLKKRVTILPNGREVQLYTKAEVAVMLGRTLVSWKALEVKGIVPKSLFIIPAGQKPRRAYSKEEVEIYDKAFRKYWSPRNTEPFTTYVERKIEKLRKDFGIDE